jgi:hypothetical protein
MMYGAFFPLSFCQGTKIFSQKEEMLKFADFCNSLLWDLGIKPFSLVELYFTLLLSKGSKKCISF